MGITIFDSLEAALDAGYLIDSPFADDEGFLHARIHTNGEWAKALVRIVPAK